MNKIILLVLSLLPLVCLADTYDDMSISFSDFKMLITRKGTLSPDKTVFVSVFNRYDSFLQNKAKPLFREIFSDADKSKHHLMDIENIPILIEINKGCILNSLEYLNSMHARYFDNTHTKEYAAVMVCFAYIRDTDVVIHRFLTDNGEYLHEIKKYDDVADVADKTDEALERLSRESENYLKYVLHE